MDKQTIDEIYRIYQKEKSIRKVAKITGINKQTVYYNLSRNNKVKRKQRVKMNLNDKRAIGLFVGLYAGDGTRYYDKGDIVKFCFHKDNKEISIFIKMLIKKIFGVNCSFYKDGGNRGAIKVHSKKISTFLDNYLVLSGYKTLNVCLKEKVNSYPKSFLEGFLTGLMLSDGYLKKDFVFVSISKKLSKNMVDALKLLGYKPHVYVHNRKKYGWHDLNMVKLNRKQSSSVLHYMDSILKKIHWDKGFLSLKTC